MIKWIILGIIAYLFMTFLTLVLFVYAERKEGASPNFVYRDEDFKDSMLVSFFWFLTLPYLLVCWSVTWLKKIVATIVETKIAHDKYKRNREKDGK